MSRSDNHGNLVNSIDPELNLNLQNLAYSRQRHKIAILVIYLFIFASIWSLTDAAPSDSVFRVLCSNLLAYLLTYSTAANFNSFLRAS